MIPDCDGRSDGRTDSRTESIMAKTALCIASYADALSKTGGENRRQKMESITRFMAPISGECVMGISFSLWRPSLI